MKKEGLAESPERRWTRPDDYVAALAERRSYRRARGKEKARTQTDQPHFLLSTLPFLALLGLMAVLAVGIMVIAFPGWQPLEKPQPQPHQQGVAARGWFEEAQKSFHH